MSLHIQNFKSKGRQEEKMTWRVLLSFMAVMVHNFWVPSEFSSSPPSRVSLMQNLGDPWAKILTSHYIQRLSNSHSIQRLSSSHYIQRLSSWKAGHGPWEVFSTASHFKYKVGINESVTINGTCTKLLLFKYVSNSLTLILLISIVSITNSFLKIIWYCIVYLWVRYLVSSLFYSGHDHYTLHSL
jgi:hypothetical protein